jgi:hypothetical protein
MPPTSQQDASRSASEIGGEVYALDRRLPLGERINGLARFRGSHWTFTRWLTHYVAPRLTRLAERTWRTSAAAVLESRTPFLLCLAQESLREGVRLLLAEWMEFRRATPGAALDLVVRVRPDALNQPAFEAVAPYWEQVQALKRQLRVRRAGVYLWLREPDPAGDEYLLAAARGLVVVARGEGFGDPFALAVAAGKPVIAPRGEGLPPDHPFAFATRPAALRFIGEPRRGSTSSVPWPIPEEYELARAIGRFAAADAGKQATSSPRAPVPRGAGSGVRGILDAPKIPSPLTPLP